MRRVVKVGGSLLLRAELPQQLAAWLAKQPPAETLVLVGGGQLIDAIRNLDAVRRVDQVAVHWRCVESLGTTFEFFADWFPHWQAIRSGEEFRAALNRGFAANDATLIAVSAFYSPQSDFDLPTDWRTTTDAIASVLAVESSADELVLLKSCQVDRSLSLDRLAAAGIVDAAMLPIAQRVKSIRVEQLAGQRQV
jgi:aspartokinase-like uncharacterized kinase